MDGISILKFIDEDSNPKNECSFLYDFSFRTQLISSGQKFVRNQKRPSFLVINV